MTKPVSQVASRGTSAQQWRDLLRERGLRATPARILVLTTLEEHGHGTPEHVFAHTEHALPGVNLSTIYRTLETLAEHAVVAHTHLTGPSSTYMLASHADHGHLVCRSCEGVFELDSRIATTFSRQITKTHGFDIDNGHLAVFGQCASCADTTEFGLIHRREEKL